MAIRRWLFLVIFLLLPGAASAQLFSCGIGGSTAWGGSGCTVSTGTGQSFYSQNALVSGLSSGTYTSGITATGSTGQTCTLTMTNGGGTGGIATVALTGTNTIAGGATLLITAYGSGYTSGPTAASVAAGTASACSGTAVVSTTIANLANLVPSGQSHTGQAINRVTKANIQSFSSEFQFVSNGWTIAFVMQNNTNGNASGGSGAQFSAGAGCEAGFYQAFASFPSTTNNIFAMDISSYDYTTTGAGSFTYSNVQVYQSWQSPCIPNDGQSWYYGTNKISTSPVPLNSPSNSINTYSGDTFDAKVGYDGSTFSMCMYDVTAGAGSCSSSTSGSGTYFQQSWGNINIPSLVGGNTAYVGLTEGTGNAATTNNLLVPLFTYTVNTAPTNQSLSTYTSQTNSGGTPVATPTFSPAAGTYTGTQSVTVLDSTSGWYACYVLSATFPTFLPQPDNIGGCTEGTLYSGPVSVSSSQTLYVMAGIAATSGGTTSQLPSNTGIAAYTINSGTDSIQGVTVTGAVIQ